MGDNEANDKINTFNKIKSKFGGTPLTVYFDFYAYFRLDQVRLGLPRRVREEIWLEPRRA